MNILNNKEDFKLFQKQYNSLHDSSFNKINLNINGDEIILELKLFWKDDINISKDNKYIIFTFNNIYKYKINDIHSWNFIFDVYLYKVIHNDKDLICFADDKAEPNLYILCSNVQYELIEK